MNTRIENFGSTVENKEYIILQTETLLEEVISLLEKESCEDEWNKFSRLLELGNSLISIRDDIEPWVRFDMHQSFNAQMHEKRSSLTGIPIVVGFFERGEAEELSLCDEINEAERFCMTSPGRSIVIGRGCKDFAFTKVKANFNLYFDLDWGWEDGIGEHIEYYDSEFGIFYRESMSGRHHYALAVDSEGWLHPMDIYNGEGSFSDEDLRKAASLQGIKPYLGTTYTFPFFFGSGNEEDSSPLKRDISSLLQRVVGSENSEDVILTVSEEDLPPLMPGEERRQVDGVWQHKHPEDGYEYWHPIARIHKGQV